MRLLDLWPKLKVPVYATPFTAALLEAKRLGEPRASEIPVNVVALDSRFKVGLFDIELVSVAHSIPESNALMLRTPHGTVLHTGDWKLDPTPVIGAPTDEAPTDGVTGLLHGLGSDSAPPTVARTVNVYRVPLTSPVTGHVREAVVQLLSAGRALLSAARLGIALDELLSGRHPVADEPVSVMACACASSRTSPGHGPASRRR